MGSLRYVTMHVSFCLCVSRLGATTYVLLTVTVPLGWRVSCIEASPASRVSHLMTLAGLLVAETHEATVISRFCPRATKVGDVRDMRVTGRAAGGTGNQKSEIRNSFIAKSFSQTRNG